VLSDLVETAEFTYSLPVMDEASVDTLYDLEFSTDTFDEMIEEVATTATGLDLNVLAESFTADGEDSDDAATVAVELEAIGEVISEYEPVYKNLVAESMLQDISTLQQASLIIDQKQAVVDGTPVPTPSTNSIAQGQIQREGSFNVATESSAIGPQLYSNLGADTLTATG
jgi:hypothetical protein